MWMIGLMHYNYISEAYDLNQHNMLMNQTLLLQVKECPLKTLSIIILKSVAQCHHEDMPNTSKYYYSIKTFEG